MRYHGQGHEIEVSLADNSSDVDGLAALFRQRYEILYAFAPLDAPLVITTWKVEARGPAPGLEAGYSLAGDSLTASPTEKGVRRAYFPDAGGWVETMVYDRYSLTTGGEIEGPALIEERESTVVVGPGDRVSVDSGQNLIAELRREKSP